MKNGRSSLDLDLDIPQALRPIWSDRRLPRAFILVLLLSACSAVPAPPFPGAALSDTERSRQLQEATVVHERARSLFEQGHYAEALSPAQQAVALRERILGPAHEDVATALTTLGLVHATLIELPRAKLLLEQALDIRRSTVGSSDPKVGESLSNLATVMYASGDFVHAIQTLEQSLEIRERALGPSHPDVAVTLSHLAIALRGMSRLEQARTTSERAVTILRSTQPPRLRDLAMAVNVAGNILGRLGNFEAAHSLLEESLHLFEQASGSRHPHVGGALVQLAMLEGKQGNYNAALPLLEQALVINETAYGKNNPEVAGNLYEIGLAERALGNITAAQHRFEQSLAIQEATVDPKHPFVALTLIELAEVKHQQGDPVGARGLLQRALRIQEQSLGREHTSIAQTVTSLGHLEALSNNLSLAEKYFERAVRIRQNALGPTHRDVGASLLDLARAKHAQGELTVARQSYERARRIIQTQQGLNPGLDDEALSRIWKKDLKGLQDYALLLATIAGNPKPSPEQQSAVADGFTVTQQARGWLMQAAMAKALAQRAVESPGDVRLAKQVEELRRKRQELWTRQNELYGLPEAQRSAKDLATVKQLLNDVQQELERASAQLRVAAPRYAELTQPEALDVQGAQRLLRPDEALVSFYTLGDRVQVWMVRAGQPALYRESPVTREWLTSRVLQIRSSLLPTARPGTNESVPVPFDVESAAELYHLLFAPVAPQLQGINNLIIIPDEVLLPLPLAALLTHRNGEPFTRLAQLYRLKQTPTPQDLASYAELPWLAKAYPLTVLPSASALKLIRQHHAPPHGQGEAFLGFGDPVLRGQGNQRGGTMMASRGMRVAVDSLQALDKLPGTREELLTVASVLHVNADTNVFLGKRATELEVRRLNNSGRLGQAKVIAFATHGLLAGEVQGVTQPALVLTPPTVPTDDNDGLLSMEDVLQLKLPNTDWVILSACNTAGDNGSGESLSGLARAFFFAGAKALLVSQWSVDDQATKHLMQETFRRYGAAHSVPPAEALQQGMLALLQLSNTSPRHAYFAHPFAWASFFLVGEGRPPLR
jgi:CHAT domain-containing protein/Tfp pilus assembly protein PilF